MGKELRFKKVILIKTATAERNALFNAMAKSLKPEKKMKKVLFSAIKPPMIPGWHLLNTDNHSATHHLIGVR